VAAFAAGLGGAPGIVCEISAAGFAVFAGNLFLLLFVHRGEASVRGLVVT
jgi:hypothetical protein